MAGCWNFVISQPLRTLMFFMSLPTVPPTHSVASTLVTTSTLLLQGGVFDITTLAVKLGSMIALLGIVSPTDWYHSLSQCYHIHIL